MFIKLHTNNFGKKVWYVSTEDGNYDAVAEDQVVAIMKVAQHMEEDLLQLKTPTDLSSDESLAALRAKLTGGGRLAT